MASHVSTCKGFELCINRGVHNQFMVEENGRKGEKGERRKEKEKRKNRREKEKEKTERKRKEVDGFFLSTLAFQRS